MAINSNVTLRRLIQELKEWADAHEMIAKFGYGDILDLYQRDERLYPYFMVNCNNQSSDQWYIKYQLEVFVGFWIWDDKSNQDRAESDSNDIVQDLLNTIRISPRWQSFSKLGSEFSGLKIVERTGDKVTGWGGTINLWVKKKSGICDLKLLMPEYDFDTQSTIVQNTPFKINGTEVDEVICGDAFDLNLIDTDGNVPAHSYDAENKELTVAAASTDSIDITINTNPFLSGVTDDVNIEVVGTDSLPKGALVSGKWRIANSTPLINGVPFATIVAEGFDNIAVKGTDGLAKGTKVANEQIIANSPITVNSAAYDSVVSELTKNIDIKNTGGIIIPGVGIGGGIWQANDLSVTVNGAAQSNQPVGPIILQATSVIYFRPQSSGYKTSYLTGDEYYNELNHPAPAAPAFGIPAFLDPTDPKKLVNNNAFGHKQRFTGISGGYWDYATLQYKLADGTVSTQAATFGTTAANTSYLIDNHTGAAYRWNVFGAANWSSIVTSILGLTHAGFNDYFLPSVFQWRSLFCIMNYGGGLGSVIPFNSSGGGKTSTPTFTFETTQHHQISGLTIAANRADATADSAIAMRWHF